MGWESQKHAFQAGMKAAEKGDDGSGNPYSILSNESEAWDEGWHEYHSHTFTLRQRPKKGEPKCQRPVSSRVSNPFKRF